MSTDWNQRVLSREGTVLSWDEKDDIQRLLVIFQWDVVDTLNTVREYGYVMELFDENLSFVNTAPSFWAEVVRALRFSIVMRSARLFDESADAIGLIKLFNILEQSDYREIMIDGIKRAREQYIGYVKYFEEIRSLRDKEFAHNDRKQYRFWKYPAEKDVEFEGEFWDKLEEILIWTREMVLSFSILTGDVCLVNREIPNDLRNLLP